MSNSFPLFHPDFATSSHLKEVNEFTIQIIKKNKKPLFLKCNAPCFASTISTTSGASLPIMESSSPPPSKSLKETSFSNFFEHAFNLLIKSTPIIIGVGILGTVIHRCYFR